MIEHKQAKSCKLTFIDISRAHFHSAIQKTSVCGVASRTSKIGLVWSFAQSMCGTRDAAANFAAIVMDTLTLM